METQCGGHKCSFVAVNWNEDGQLGSGLLPYELLGGTGNWMDPPVGWVDLSDLRCSESGRWSRLKDHLSTPEDSRIAMVGLSRHIVTAFTSPTIGTDGTARSD